MLTFGDVLEREGFAARDVTVMLHSPKAAALQAVLPARVKTRCSVMETYQATHGGKGALKAGRLWVGAFAKVAQDVLLSHSWMLFAGLCANEGARNRTYADVLSDPNVAFLRTRDRSDGARYVGSAYGETNLLGRWQAHVAGDAGVTVELARRDPAGFDFSILERVSPDMEIGDITIREQGWMTRLHTKVDGLNR